MALLRTATPSDVGPVIESEYVTLRTPQMSDYPAWAELRAQSRESLPTSCRTGPGNSIRASLQTTARVPSEVQI